MWEKKSGKNENRRMHYSEDREERPPDYSEPKAASAIQTYGTRRTPQHKLSVPTAHLKEAVPMRTMAKA